MNTESRRQFLKLSAGLTAGLTLGGQPASGEGITDKERAVIPPHKPLALPGLHAYAQKSIAAGEAALFRVSSTVPYTLRVLRLAGEVDDPKTDVELVAIREEMPSVQPIHLGSYVNVPESIKEPEITEGLSVECWVRPWGFNRCQGIVTQSLSDSEACGLYLDADSRV